MQDEFISLRDHKYKLTLGVSTILFCISIIMCTNVSTKRYRTFIYIDYNILPGWHVYTAAI